MVQSKLSYFLKAQIIAIGLLACSGGFIHASVPGQLKEFCDSQRLTHFFYGPDGKEEISHYVIYHKRLHKNILEQSLDPKKGSQLLKSFKESSQLGLTVRCEKVPKIQFPSSNI